MSPHATGNLTFSNAITGTGSVTTYSDAMTLIGLSGTNTYTGATTISSGTLALMGSGSIATSNSVNNSGTFDISGTTAGASIKDLSGAGGTTLGARTLTVTDASSNYTGVLSGTGGFTVAGGTQLLSGTNTYNGATTISGGTLALSAGGSIAQSSGVAATGNFDISNTTAGASIRTLSGAGSTALGARTLTITAGASTYDGAMNGTGGLTVSGGTETLSGNHTYTGATTISGGTLALSGSGLIGQSSGVSIDGTLDVSQVVSSTSIKTLAGAGTVALGAKRLIVTAGAAEFSGILQNGGIGGGAAGKFDVVGGTQTLSGVNTFTGLTYIGGNGTLALKGSGSIANSSYVNLASTGIFDISQTTTGASIGGLLGSAGQTVSLGSKALTLTGNIGPFGGVIQDGGIGGGVGGAVAIAGMGVATFSGANTYTGATTINAGGQLSLSGSGSIATSSGVANSGTFDISNTTSGASITTLSGFGGTDLGTKTLTITNGSTTYSGVMTGTGGLTISNRTQTLNGANIYTGATTINSGALVLSRSDAISQSSGAVMTSGTLDAQLNGASITTLSGTGGNVSLFNTSLTLTNQSGTFGGRISSSGNAGLTLTGMGTETLTGSNIYSGATTISSGTLALSGTGSIGQSDVVDNNGTFDISGASGSVGFRALSRTGRTVLGFNKLQITVSSTTYGGVLSGTGGIGINGGTQTLTGTNTYTGATTLDGGTLALSGTGSIAASSGVTNAGTFDISGTTAGASIKTLTGNGSTVLGARTLTVTDAAGTYSGAMSGTGGFTLTSGAQIFSGANTYTGATTVNGGTLTLTGSLAATPTTIAESAVFAGNGTTAGATTVYGVLSPGVASVNGGVGTITINAPLTFGANAVYSVATTPSAASRTNVTGLATLGNATVYVAASAGSFAMNTQYTILNATGGFAGSRFSPTVTTNKAFLAPALSYDTNNVFLTILPSAPVTAANGTTVPDYRTAATTGNQLNIASGLTYAGILNSGAGPILNALNQLTVPQAQAAFDSLTGEGISGAQNAAFTAGRLFTGGIADQILLFGGAPNSVVVPTAPAAATLAYAPTQAFATPIRVREPLPASRPLYSWRAWGVGYGASQTINANAVLGNAQQRIGMGGGAVGVDYTWAPGMLTGIAVGGSDGSFSVGARQTSGSTTGGHAAWYTLAEFGNVYAASTTSVSVFGNRTTRTVGGFGGLNGEILRGNFTSTEFRSRVEFGYRFGIAQGVTLTPFYAVEAAKLRSDGFTETPLAGAGIFALNVRGQTASSVPMFFGARLTGDLDLGNGMRLRPSVQAAYVAEFAPVRNQIAGLANLPGAAFIADGARPARASVQVKTGAELALLDNVAISANFDGEFSNRSNTYAGKGAIKVRW